MREREGIVVSGIAKRSTATNKKAKEGGEE
jgi:hypothetical protein